MAVEGRHPAAVPTDPAWVVLKFGGTSVSSLANWRNVARVVAARRHEGLHVLIVHSALTGITDRLERLLEAALQGAHAELLASIEDVHRTLARALGIESGPELERHFGELAQITTGLALVQEVSDRTRARVMAAGELMATDLGARFLAAQGLPVEWVDARTLLAAEVRRGASARASVLSATCGFAPDPQLAARLSRLPPVLVTQGFIASDADGHTVLLGRGGSDTSAAYLAAKLEARRLEIWTDVPGMFSANPRSTPTARLLRALHYDEAQEIASNGAKVLHPRCILPARQYHIPLHVYATQTPDLEGTVVSGATDAGAPQVKAVCIKKGITLIAMDSPGMWHQVGFLADAFQVFKDHGLSVDLVSTSETNVSVTLDPAANTLEAGLLDELLADLSRICKAQVFGPCASVSLVGRNIRAILHQLADAFELFAEQKVYLVSQAANDLNFTFVVDESQGDRLVEQLHELLMRPVPGDRVLGPTWEQLFRAPAPVTPREAPWWLRKRALLAEALGSRDSAYVYDLATLGAAARRLRSLASIARVLYAVKANPHPEVLRHLCAAGLDFDCVSRGEIERVLEAVPEIPRERLLYTPNFASRDEYTWALQQNVRVTLDSLYALEAWAATFAGHAVFVRVDTGIGRGHHRHVRTAGAQSKFGIPLGELDTVARLARDAGVRIVGLHAHSGSGIFDVSNWEDNARALAELAQGLPEVRVLDVGGGLGVPDRTEQAGLDLAQLDAALARIRHAYPRLDLWLESGRYVVAPAGVLLARVTQVKAKGDVKYVGVATGMNSLIRPALYGAYHEIVNLTRPEVQASELVNVVGPICESGDVLGHDRQLPPSREGDILVFVNTGAYGHSMSSRYNLREPAEEICI
ncbi:MAG TPA: bifunctional aspartate kinase/diaminopimelate decarboxylase [Steroidobacteraceae bacterium]|nr:bifunctional aspartate kinase/diaminopimelate decarboxylase [Steroidobacteraceae bacterium]